MARSLLRPLLRAIPLAATLGVAAGGWAVVTVDDLPDAVVTGKPITLTFVVRQHGRTPMDNVHPTIDAALVGSNAHFRADAVSAGSQGRYTSTLTLPDTGQWRLTINSGWGTSHIDLEPIAAIRANQTAPAFSQTQRGRRLFVAKGCVTCHLHSDVAGSGVVQVGPDLSSLRLPADFLQKFLADPSMQPPAAGQTSQMPNLNLKPAEIAALVAFISRDGAAARTGQ